MDDDLANKEDDEILASSDFEDYLNSQNAHHPMKPISPKKIATNAPKKVKQVMEEKKTESTAKSVTDRSTPSSSSISTSPSSSQPSRTQESSKFYTSSRSF